MFLSARFRERALLFTLLLICARHDELIIYFAFLFVNNSPIYFLFLYTLHILEGKISLYLSVSFLSDGCKAWENRSTFCNCSAGQHIYCIDYKKVIQECQKRRRLSASTPSVFLFLFRALNIYKTMDVLTKSSEALLEPT